MCGVYWYRCCVNNSLNEAGLTNDSDCGHYVRNDIVMVALLVMNVATARQRVSS